MAVVFSERYGYEIGLPKSLTDKLVKLYQTDEEAYEELNNHIRELFPYVEYIFADMVSTEAFADYHWDKDDTKKQAQAADKEIQKAIRKWLKNYKEDK